MKLFLSSSENGKKETTFDYLKKNNNQYYLYSYYTLRKLKNKEVYLDVPYVFLDSGAHTLQKPGKDTDWDKFLNEYISFLKKYNNHIDFFVELDVENKTGLSWVEKATKKIISETGREPIVVWHRERGWDYYKYMCKNYKYVGFSAFLTDQFGKPEVPKKYIPLFIKEAHKNNAKIHAFGYTQKDLYLYNFDTSDSSTWTMYSRFFTIQKFMGYYMKVVKTYRNITDKNVYYKLGDYSTKEWIKYQKFLDKNNERS